MSGKSITLAEAVAAQAMTIMNLESEAKTLREEIADQANELSNHRKYFKEIEDALDIEPGCRGQHPANLSGIIKNVVAAARAKA